MTYITDLNTHALPKDYDTDYYVDFFDSSLNTIKSFRPENWSAELNIRSPDTISLEISFSALDMSGSTIVSSHDFIGPYRHGWLLRYGWVPISAGLITSVETELGSDFMSVGGKDWMHYFERRQFPFNGDPTVSGNDHGQLEAFSGSKPGFLYTAGNVDISVHLTNILNTVLAKANSWPITYTLASIGTNIKYPIQLGDQRFVSDFIQEMSDIAPGFDFETTWDMKFQIASPYFYGDPSTFDITDSTRPEWAYVFDQSDDAHTPYNLRFTNNGPLATHVSGYGSGNVGNGQHGTLVVTKGYAGGSAQFHRLDASYDFSTIRNRLDLDKKTSKELAYGLQPQHEIPVTVLPNQITNFWTKFKPGRAIFINQELVYHQINSGQRIVTMTINDAEGQGDPTVELGLNQVYDTSDSIGAIEG
jgi:hypothetical protein